VTFPPRAGEYCASPLPTISLNSSVSLAIGEMAQAARAIIRAGRPTVLG